MSPPPVFNHQGILRRLRRELEREGWAAAENIGVVTPTGKFIPDLVVATDEYFDRDSEDCWQAPGDFALVAEVTSREGTVDREYKRKGYAEAKIPLYLLVDRQRKEVVLFSEPDGRDYRGRLTVPLDEPVPLPDPFGFTLEDIG